MPNTPVLIVSRESPEAVAQALVDDGAKVTCAAPEDAPAKADDSQPLLAVLAEDVRDPIEVGRRIHLAAPQCYLLILANRADELELRRRLMPISPIGSLFGFADPAHPDHLVATRAALRAARQRRQFKATLSRAHKHVGAADSIRPSRLLVSDRFLASVLNNAHDAIISVDLSLAAVSINTAAEAMFGIDASKAIDRPLTDALDPPTRDQLMPCLEQAMEELRPVTADLTLLRGTSEQHLEALFAPLLNERGAMVGLSMTARDITDRKRAEAEVQALSRDLERMVVERTRELEAAVAELEGFTYTVSHDLRAPLRAINATSAILLEDLGDALTEDAKRQLERQRVASARMAQLIDDLLRLSRLSRMEVKREPGDIAAIAREVAADLQRDGRADGVTFEIQDSMPADFDHQIVPFLMLNLMENACKFSPDGGVVRVRAERREGRDVFSVSDEGIGFDMTYVGKLFLPFERLHTKVEIQGTGIGLANVHRIVQRHGGEVWAESEPGKGATFFFTLQPRSSPLVQTLYGEKSDLG
jgi:PAS domain S-box-containing protein